MAMKLRTLPMQGPRRGLPETGFIRLRLAFFILARPPEASIAPSMSFTMRDRSDLSVVTDNAWFLAAGRAIADEFHSRVSPSKAVLFLKKIGRQVGAIMHGRGQGATLLCTRAHMPMRVKRRRTSSCCLATATCLGRRNANWWGGVTPGGLLKTFKLPDGMSIPFGATIPGLANPSGHGNCSTH